MSASYESRLKIAKADIVAALRKFSTPVLSTEQLRALLQTNREFWRLGQITLPKFLEWVMQQTPLRVVRLEFPFRPVIRYCWGEVSLFEIVQSINQQGYFSHYSAIQLHGLTEQIPKVIYFNTEQAAQPGGGILTQAAIDRTFKGKCRISSNVADFGDRSVCQISGGNTGDLGVLSIAAPEGKTEIRVTNLERTLIDATIRPVYSGGIFEVRNAFVAAKDLASVNKIAAYLATMNYTYPYHQSLGFLMQRSGYRKSQLDLLRQFPIHFNFYLDYGLRELDYDPEWKLFFPKGF